MDCDCECHCGGIPSRDAMNDRLYWVEVLAGADKGGKFAAWRDYPKGRLAWRVSAEGSPSRPFYADDDIRIIHEIIPEE